VADAMRILIADDEPVIRMGLKTMLEEHGYKVVGEASDGEQAVILAGKTSPDLIFMDIKMPGLDGIAAASTIMTRSPKPIILLTARDDLDTRLEGMYQGVSEFLTKPINTHELYARVRAQLHIVDLGRQLQTVERNLRTLRTRGTPPSSRS